MKNRIVLVLVITFGAVSLGFALKGASTAYNDHHKTISVKAPVSLPPGNKAPSEEFLIDYANYKELQKEVRDLEIDSKLIEKRRLLQGTIDELNAKIPAGFTWDEDTQSFKPRQLTPVPLAPQPAKP